MKSTPSKKKHPGGRPPKFKEARRPITVTLPERTLEQLALINADRAKAIVKAADSMITQSGEQEKLVEVLEVAKGLGIIVIGTSNALKKIPFLRMVEIAPTRYLLTVTPGTSVDSLEIAVTDLLETLPDENTRDRQILTELKHHFSYLRRSRKIAKAEMLLVSTG